ncbi:hypothetical protein ACHWQZ_G017700 [Mnemiopsis leidyi]
MTGTLAMESEQAKYLEAAKEVVKREAFNMQRCLDKGQLMDGLRHATEMLNELRTSILMPKSYYELYMMVTMELTHLTMYMSAEFIKENKIADLYELVQHAGNIIPRLYLLITVGVVYIKSKECSRKDILQDLVEMCRGVQHPLRGLFLRNFLLTSTRDVLPDVDETSADTGTVDDSIDFILLNFSEMNKLWVRMQHQGHSRDRTKREQERLELKILVGTNLERLSRLEGVTVSKYQNHVLPAILKQLINCKDSIAQEYLMDCIIQVFPDEFHLKTLDIFLDTCCQPQGAVNVRNILISKIGRLSNYAQADPSNIPEDIKLFEIFSGKVTQIIQSRTEMPPEDILALQSALIKLALNVYPSETGYVDQVLQNSFNIFEEDKSRAKGCSTELSRMLRVPVDHYQDILTILQLEHFTPLFSFLDHRIRKELCVYIMEHVIQTDTYIDSHDQVDLFLTMMTCLISDQPDQPKEPEDPEDFELQQSLVGRAVHQMTSSVPDQQFLILNMCKKHLLNGGDKRIQYTLPSLVFRAMELCRVYFELKEEDEKWEKKVCKILQYINSLLSALVKAEYWDLALRLFLQSALICDLMGIQTAETIAYEFVSRAFAIYEEEVSDSKAQLVAISLIIATFERTINFSEENHEPLRSQCLRASSKLLKKPDQCRAVSLCAHIYWSGKNRENEGSAMRETKRVLDSMKKAVRISNQCMEPSVQVQLFVELLNKYIYFLDNGCTDVTQAMISQLVGKIRDDMPGLEASEATNQIVQHFNSTLAYIKSKHGMSFPTS